MFVLNVDVSIMKTLLLNWNSICRLRPSPIGLLIPQLLPQTFTLIVPKTNKTNISAFWMFFFWFFIIIELFFFSSKARLRANKMCVCRFAFVVKVQERWGWPLACSLPPLDSLGTKLKEILRNYYWKREWR